jgi:hypothetical protein
MCEEQSEDPLKLKDLHTLINGNGAPCDAPVVIQIEDELLNVERIGQFGIVPDVTISADVDGNADAMSLEDFRDIIDQTIKQTVDGAVDVEIWVDEELYDFRDVITVLHGDQAPKVIIATDADYRP